MMENTIYMMLSQSRMIIPNISVAATVDVRSAFFLFSWPCVILASATVAVKSFFFLILLGLPHTKYFAFITVEVERLFLLVFYSAGLYVNHLVLIH